MKIHSKITINNTKILCQVFMLCSSFLDETPLRVVQGLKKSGFCHPNTSATIAIVRLKIKRSKVVSPFCRVKEWRVTSGILLAVYTVSSYPIKSIQANNPREFHPQGRVEGASQLVPLPPQNVESHLFKISSMILSKGQILSMGKSDCVNNFFLCQPELNGINLRIRIY